MQTQTKNLLTVSEVAKKIGVSADTIRRWDKRGLIKAHRTDLNYRVFDVSEIKKLHDKQTNYSNSVNRYKILKNNKKTPYSVIELFAGAGGTALGFSNAGLNHALLIEKDKDAASTLKTNRPSWNVIQEDVTQFSFKGMHADVIEGGFPCQAFSVAGKKLGFEDTRGTLIFDFLRSVKEIKPKVVVGENVRGLLNHDNGQTLNTIISILRKQGYRVAFKILRSHYLDVPQKRDRLVIIGTRKDLKLPILFPREKNYFITLKEALQGCPASEGQAYPEQKKMILEQVPAGGYWRDLPEDLQKKYMKASYFMGGGKTGMARRLSWDEPSLTLTCSPAQKQTERCHPEETRPLTIREYARIQTFPDDWKFIGSVASQYRQIGNAVPVNLGYHIASCVIAMLNNEPDLNSMELVQPIQGKIGYSK